MDKCGKTGLVIRNGSIVKFNSRQPKDSIAVTSQQQMEGSKDTHQSVDSDKLASHQPIGSTLSGYRKFRSKVYITSFLHNAHTQAGYTGTLPSHPYQFNAGLYGKCSNFNVTDL